MFFPSSVYVLQSENLPLCTRLVRCRKKGKKRDICNTNLGPPFSAQIPQPSNFGDVLSCSAGNLSKVALTTQNLGLNGTLSLITRAAYK